MTPTVASKAERLVPQRLKTDMRITSLMTTISSAQIMGNLHPDLAEILRSPRFRGRLERRYLRKARVFDSLPCLLSSEAESIVALGEHGLHALIVDTGIVCHYAALRRIVDVKALANLAKILGIALEGHDARITKASDSLTLSRLIRARSPEEIEPLASAMLRDGLQCWNCWIERQPTSLHGFFRQLTPPALRSVALSDADACTARNCRHRAALFDIRRALVAERDEMPLRRKA